MHSVKARWWFLSITAITHLLLSIRYNIKLEQVSCHLVPNRCSVDTPRTPLVAREVEVLDMLDDTYKNRNHNIIISLFLSRLHNNRHGLHDTKECPLVLRQFKWCHEMGRNNEEIWMTSSLQFDRLVLENRKKRA